MVDKKMCLTVVNMRFVIMRWGNKLNKMKAWSVRKFLKRRSNASVSLWLTSKDETPPVPDIQNEGSVSQIVFY